MANALGASVDELLGTPYEDPASLDDAVRLVAQSANRIPPSQDPSRSVGARELDYDAKDPRTGKTYRFLEVTTIRNIEVFAGKGARLFACC